MLHDVTLILKNANEQLRLCCGLSTTNNDINLDGLVNMNGYIDVNAEVVETKSTIELIKEVDEEFADLYGIDKQTNNTDE